MKAAKALKEKGDTPEELLRSIKENEAAVAEAQRTVDAWKAIVGEKTRREEAAKAEAERKSAEERERAEAEEKTRIEAEEKTRIEVEKKEAEKKEAERIAAEKAEEEARVEAERKAEEKRKTEEKERKAKTDGDGQNGFNFFTGTINELIAATRKKGSSLIKKVLSAASNRLIADLKDKGVDISPEYNHTIDNNAINHALNRHSSDKEKEQGQIPLTEKDIENVNDVIDNYDEIKTEKNSRGQDIIIYKKRYTDGTTLYVEEVRTGRKELAMASMRKQRSRKLTDADDLKSTPSSDLPSASADKGSKKPEKKQEKQSVFDKAKEIADKEEKKRKAEAEDDSVIGQATRAVGKKKKVNLFKYTASEKNSNSALRGVHYANGYAYASDGYILFKEKADYPKEWEGTTRDKDGNLIDGKYPDTEKAIPRLVHIPDKEVESLPSKEVLDFAIAASKKLKGEAIPVAIDGLFFNAVNLKKFLEAVASKGMDKVVYRHPMLYATNGKDEIVMMPTVNTLEGALDIADRMESAGLPKEQIDAWKAHIEAADKKMSFDDFKRAVENAKKEGVRPTEPKKKSIDRSVRESRSEKRELTAEERELRDNLVERMRKGGLDVVTDSEEMQRVIDTENERTRMMGAGSVREHRVYHGSGADFDVFDHSHMGEGEGAQAYGWGTYVTEVEGIGRTYAIQNTTTHNDALRALQHDVDAISDHLNRHRDDLKYDEEQLKRANEWRAEAELDYELFKDEAEKLKEKYGEASPEYRNHLFNDIYTDEMKRAQSSVKSTEESIQYRKEKIAELEKALKDKQAEIDELPKEFPRHLYTVEIPDDNGSNYLDWNGHPAESLLKDVGSFLESEGFERVQDNPARYEKGESTVVLNPKATGADLYAELQKALGNDKKASQALAESGCIGIKYPADNMRGGREDGAKNYVIFNENDAKITDHTRFLRTAGGEVYGLVKDGRIYLDPKVATSETAVHEYTHLWGDMLRRKDSEQWSHTVKELKNSVLWEEVKELYPELKTDDEIADEVLSTFSGRRGAERLREEARRVAEGEGGVFTKAKAIETLERVKEAIARFWEGVARMFGINRYRSAEELADMAMKDLINGVKPTSRTFTFDNFYKDTKAVFEGTERPEGKPDYTSYSGSEYWYGEDNGGKYVVRGSDHWSGEFKVKDGERTNVGRNHYSEITEDGMLPIGAQGSLKFGWEKGLSKPVGSGISAAIDRRGSGDSNNIASCYWYIDNAKEKDNKGFTYGKAYLSEFEDKERRRDIPGDDWRDIQGLEGGTRAMAVKKANDRFNEELELQVKGELEEGHVYKLGMPSEILLSTGVPNLPIQMSAQRLEDKATKFGHNFDIAEVKDLVNAIQKPIAIFEYGDRNKSQNLIVEIQKDGKNFIIGLSLNPVVKGKALEINSVRNVFPKDNAEWLNWISQNKLLYAG